jgi:outer membrane protein assembly factor BamB
MEPQHNYSSNLSGTGQKVYGRSGSKKGCFIVGLIIFLIVSAASAVLIYYLYTKVGSTVEDITDKFKDINTKDKFRGNRNADSRFSGVFIDAVIVPGSNPKIFMLTDASKTYIQTVKRPGYQSTGAECIECKTIAYVYDPAGDNVIKSTDYKFPDIITLTNIAVKDGRVFQFTKSYNETQPGVNVYDANTGELLSETKEFISSFPELSSGLVELNYKPLGRYAEFDTKDGRTKILYSVEYNKIFPSLKEMNSQIESSVSGESKIYALANTTNDSRKQLFKITAPKGSILTQGDVLMSYADRPNMLKTYKAASEKVSDKSYIEGLIYFQDEDYVFIVSQDQAGKKANRIFTCIDAKTGSEKWSVQQENLFDIFKIDELQNSSQSFFSSKDKISASRYGTMVLLKYKGDGVTAFDVETGKKLWSLQPSYVGL